MEWRLAKSLEVLTKEIRSRWPGTTVWTVGDAAHRATWSDHNPNPAAAVCAIDVLGDGGMGLAWFAERIRARSHPALKYVIYNRRIASRGGTWGAYSGPNPHTTHVHVSVGVGPDGRSTGAYDDLTPWGITEEGTDMATAREVWLTDDLIKAPATREDQANTHWTAAAMLSDTANHAREGAARGELLGREVAALRTAVGELAARAPAVVDHSALADAIVARLPTTGLTADDVRAALADVLLRGAASTP